MKEKHILTLAIILFVLVCYYMIFEFAAPPKKTEDIGFPILLLDYRDVQKFTVSTSDGRELVCERKRGSWNLIKGQKPEKWANKVADFVVYLLQAVEIDKIPVGNNQLNDYGLENPSYQITITDVTEKTYQLLVGDSTPVRTSVYAKFVESPHIIIVGALLNWELSKLSPLLAPA